ncbi:kinase-like protein [Mollisia scopiformis]|uniref:non-specific serine/threonine protein kinase n=1 Tax=Mollisia scopiformis TaxID=149040 RepID=A0A194X1S8_MOLSC|nr:kinase-like protein [Mollisia scopiformis]KUJ13792.1 kinase-like protein [Mollisia scopiformis]
MDSRRAVATQGAEASTGGTNSTRQLSGGSNEEPPSKRARSSDDRVPEGPASMRHLLNPETSVPGGGSNDAAPANFSSEMCEMKAPQHTERSYVQEVKSNSLPTTAISPHQIFGEGQVPVMRTESLVQGSLALIDIIESPTADATPRKTFARKTIPASRVQNARGFLEALEANKSLRHQHLVTVLLTYEEVDPQNHNYGIIMDPVAQGNLKDYLEEVIDSGKYMEPDTRMSLRKWFGCLASALAYIHAKDIRHENIQPSNILVKDSDVFFTFFGVSKYFRGDDIPGGTTSGPDAQPGTYVAPEVESTRPPDFKADIFSLGCVYLELLATLAGKYRKGFAQWRSKQTSSDIQIYLGQLSVYLECGQDKSSSEFYQRMVKVCSQMLEDNPSIRPSAFMIAKSVLEVQQRSPESDCDCMIPWFSSGDCTITMKLSGLNIAKLRTKSKNMGFGSFRLPLR